MQADAVGELLMVMIQGIGRLRIPKIVVLAGSVSFGPNSGWCEELAVVWDEPTTKEPAVE